MSQSRKTEGPLARQRVSNEEAITLMKLATCF